MTHKQLAAKAAKRMATTTRKKQTVHTLCIHLIAIIRGEK